jgi:hypothetical protein
MRNSRERKGKREKSQFRPLRHSCATTLAPQQLRHQKKKETRKKRKMRKQAEKQKSRKTEKQQKMRNSSQPLATGNWQLKSLLYQTRPPLEHRNSATGCYLFRYSRLVNYVQHHTQHGTQPSQSKLLQTTHLVTPSPPNEAKQRPFTNYLHSLTKQRKENSFDTYKVRIPDPTVSITAIPHQTYTNNLLAISTATLF